MFSAAMSISLKLIPLSNNNELSRFIRCLSREKIAPLRGFFFSFLDIFLIRLSTPYPVTDDMFLTPFIFFLLLSYYDLTKIFESIFL